MTTPRERLRQAMIDAGCSTPTEAWNKHKKLFSLSSITSALNGHRDISRQMAVKFGKAFNVSPGWILYGGDGTPQSSLDGVEFAEVLLRAAALPDAEARKLYEALGQRFGPSTPQESLPADQAANATTTTLRQQRRS